MLSSMTPTIVEKTENYLWLLVRSGGSAQLLYQGKRFLMYMNTT
jgi:gamma-glutamyltranspeptidase